MCLCLVFVIVFWGVYHHGVVFVCLPIMRFLERSTSTSARSVNTTDRHRPRQVTCVCLHFIMLKVCFRFASSGISVSKVYAEVCFTYLFSRKCVENAGSLWSSKHCNAKLIQRDTLIDIGQIITGPWPHWHPTLQHTQLKPRETLQSPLIHMFHSRFHPTPRNQLILKRQSWNEPHFYVFLFLCFVVFPWYIWFCCAFHYPNTSGPNHSPKF